MHLIIKNFGGHFVCKSNFNISKITVSEFTDTFFNGVTMLQGEIDSRWLGTLLCASFLWKRSPYNNRYEFKNRF